MTHGSTVARGSSQDRRLNVPFETRNHLLVYNHVEACNVFTTLDSIIQINFFIL